jgi:hypothetical protein
MLLVGRANKSTARRWIACMASCFALATLGSAALAPQAIAACERGWVCLYNGPSWETPPARFHDNGLQSLVPFGFNDIVSSVSNATNRSARLHQNADGTGTFACIEPESVRTFFGIPFNNQASSIEIFPNGVHPSCAGSE